MVKLTEGCKLVLLITTTCLPGVRFSTAAAGRRKPPLFPITFHFCPSLGLLKKIKASYSAPKSGVLQP